MRRKLIRRFQEKNKSASERHFRRFYGTGFRSGGNRYWKYFSYHAWDEANCTRYAWIPMKKTAYCKKSKIIHKPDGSMSCTYDQWETKCSGRLLRDDMLKSNRDILRKLNLHEKKDTPSK